MMSSPPKVSVAAPDEAVGKARLGDAAVDRDGFAARRPDLVGNGVARRGIEIVDDDARAFAGELQRNGPSDAAPDPVISATFPSSLAIRLSF